MLATEIDEYISHTHNHTNLKTNFTQKSGQRRIETHIDKYFFIALFSKSSIQAIILHYRRIQSF
jgi:hypothetical protein